jgi:hypothetical protein
VKSVIMWTSYPLFTSKIFILRVPTVPNTLIALQPENKIWNKCKVLNNNELNAEYQSKTAFILFHSCYKFRLFFCKAIIRKFKKNTQIKAIYIKPNRMMLLQVAKSQRYRINSCISWNWIKVKIVYYYIKIYCM